MSRRHGPWKRFMDRHAPSREEVLASPWLKPFGHRVRASELWRFTRRSVPRGVFAGLFIGIFLMVPGLQIVGAALLAIPMRANIPIAAAMTFLSNPATTPIFLIASLEVGSNLGFKTDLGSFMRLYERHAAVEQWMRWLFSDAAPALVTGLFIIGLLFGVAGFLVSQIFWRWWVGRKWRDRAQFRKEASDVS